MNPAHAPATSAFRNGLWAGALGPVRLLGERLAPFRHRTASLFGKIDYVSRTIMAQAFTAHKGDGAFCQDGRGLAPRMGTICRKTAAVDATYSGIRWLTGPRRVRFAG